jgi:hypothetical protein
MEVQRATFDLGGVGDLPRWLQEHAPSRTSPQVFSWLQVVRPQPALPRPDVDSAVAVFRA